MLALYRCGQVTEALAAYREGRRVLAEEFGLEPGEELRRLEAAILRADPALDVPAATVAPATAAPSPEAAPAVAAAPPPAPEFAVPMQLPADVDRFTGRAADLGRLDGWLRQRAPDRPAAMVVTAISGTAGVGKTALAVHWAQRVRADFPDGQLYVDLRGYDPDQPMRPDAVLAIFLRELGVADVPLDVDQRAARYRTVLAGKRMLVVLDNASSVEQVRPLLPGAGPCAVLVTSRDSLAGLVARHGAQRLTLDLLPYDDALRLLTVLVGDRVGAEPAAAARLLERCARLPLAIRVAAERAAARPDLALRDLVEELDAEERRLDALGADGDERTAVRAVFSWSYRHLEPVAARTFRLLGLHPGRDVDLPALAALTGDPIPCTAAALDALARAHLVQAAGRRTGMHDLLRAYAGERAREAGEADAVDRVLEYYAAAAERAAAVVYPADAAAAGEVPFELPELADADAARGWLDAERPNLVAASGAAVDRGRHDLAIRLAWALWRYLDAGGHGVDALAVHGNAAAAARAAGDAGSEGRALGYLGVVHWRGCRYDESTEYFTRSLELLDRAGEKVLAARTRMNFGMLREARGEPREAVDLYGTALDVFRETDYRIGMVDALRNLGDLATDAGRLEDGIGWHRQALDIALTIDDPLREALCRHNLGETLLRLGRYREAAECMLRAPALFRRCGFRTGEAHSLIALGEVRSRQGQHEAGATAMTEALDVFREIGDHQGEVDALVHIGRLRLDQGTHRQALEAFEQAVRLAERAGTVALAAQAHDGLARCHETTGTADAAVRHWRSALDLYRRLENDADAEEVERRLQALTRAASG
jgi:tetratricopeptide (TPR) repeat protein